MARRNRPPVIVERALEQVAPEYRTGERWTRRVLRWLLVAVLAVAIGWTVVKGLIEARPNMPRPKPAPIVIDLLPSKN